MWRVLSGISVVHVRWGDMCVLVFLRHLCRFYVNVWMEWPNIAWSTDLFKLRQSKVRVLIPTLPLMSYTNHALSAWEPGSALLAVEIWPFVVKNTEEGQRDGRLPERAQSSWMGGWRGLDARMTWDERQKQNETKRDWCEWRPLSGDSCWKNVDCTCMFHREIMENASGPQKGWGVENMMSVRLDNQQIAISALQLWPLIRSVSIHS